MCAHLTTVHILRRDSLSSPIDYEHVKHMWVQNGFLNLSMGQHDKDRHYAMWPVEQIDHIHMEEEQH